MYALNLFLLAACLSLIHCREERVHGEEDLHSPHEGHTLLPEEVAEHWDSLDDEGRRAAADAFFGVLDTNGDGALSKDEVAVRVEWALRKEDEDLARDDFDSYDSNEDGLIDWKEYMGQEVPTEEELSKDVELNLEYRRFNDADENLDGSLTPEEFYALYMPHNFPRMLPYVLETVFLDFDTNKDKKVSRSEFFEIELEDESFEATEEMFKDSDLNNDNELTENELVNMVQTSLTKFSQREAAELVDMVDLNDDKSLDADEVHQGLSHFLKSSMGKHVLEPHTEL